METNESVPKIWVSELIFNDQTKISLEKDDIIIIVGANNSGKSATLKEIKKMLMQKSNIGKILLDLTIEKNDADILSFMDSIAIKRNNGNPMPHYAGYNFNIYQPSITSNWKNYKNGLPELHPVFVNLLDTEQRLQAAKPPGSINLTADAESHPIHFLQKDDNLEAKFSDYFKQAFGTDLVVHRNAGSIVPLYVGKRPTYTLENDRTSRKYRDELEKLDLLAEQGDGMRSFVGVLLNAFISNYSILLIDEPEAFLHPPQARLLGKMLAKDLPDERQLFLSTHSEDFLHGILDSDIGNLKIIRINRKANINHIRVLNKDDIHRIWNDSLLRNSNILSGLFHDKVVICESDSDCRFFSALLSSIYEDLGTLIPDVLFIHCGGKHRIPTAIKALCALDVDVRVITDFDVLNSQNPLQEMFTSLGGNWDQIEKYWKIVKMQIEQKKPELLAIDLKKAIDSIFDSTTENIFPKEKRRQIENELRKSSAWEVAKSVGKAYIPSGDATQAFELIQTKFKEVGLFILEVGELECFVRSVGNHGPKWVSEVLEKNIHEDPEFNLAKDFIKQVIA